MTIAGLLIAGAGLLLLLAGRLHVMLHLFQLEHYEPARLRLWVRRRRDRLKPIELGSLFLAGSALAVAARLDSAEAVLACGAVIAGCATGAGLRTLHRPQVKPLIFTARARRLYAVALAFPALALLALGLLARPDLIAAGGTLIGLAAHVAAPELLAAAAGLLRPVQAIDNRRFVRLARRRLARIDPLVIAVTGSYGKTTTKACLAEVAELRGAACPTPASFNTYLGIVRAINEGLEPRHKSFIVEMGAYRRGDIAELCQLVQPRLGVLTAIGAAHLERFASLDETERVKGELAVALPAEGALITRADDLRCRRAAGRASCRVVLFSPAPHPESQLWATNVELGDGGTRFVLQRRLGAEVETAPVSARLLGTHNVANLLAAAAVGGELGLPLSAIAPALGRVKPPAHRLSPIVNAAAGVIVIDDAYNANPEGAAAALDVLAAHPAERRLLVTPGMVELGQEQDAANRRFGAKAAGVCDMIILVGREQTAAIRIGLEDVGFPEEGLRVVADVIEAQALLAQMTRRGDVVLFENDLPDLYQGQNGSDVQTGPRR